jgi:hypothetical protein
MQHRLITAAFALAIAAPFGAASAQDAATLACADYAAMDNAGQMAAVAEIESLNSEMATSQEVSSEEIHQKLTAECGAAPDALVADVWKKIKGM